MEYNKEEALRAMSIAESRLQCLDFEGAQKFALKARHLFPQLENLSQILVVCNVHCAAKVKIAGETNWHAVLKLEKTADEQTIKKRYHGLALVLHPDKNKLSGAAAAFQIVGEAYKILVDRKKSSQYSNLSPSSFNHVRKSHVPFTKQPGPGVSTTATKPSFAYFSGLNQSKPSPFLGARLFWTMCPSCRQRFQYDRNLLCKEVKCVKCYKIFLTYDLMNSVTKTEDSENVGNNASFNCQRVKPDKSNLREDHLPKNCDMNFINAHYQRMHDRDQEAEPPVSQKRRKENHQTLKPSAEKTSSILQRSNTQEQNATSIDSQPSKRSRKAERVADRVPSNSIFLGVPIEGNRRTDSKCETFAIPENLSYSASEFHNFENERCESKFAVDQIWALYDNINGMPRFYARVRKVYCRTFKLQLIWLENDPRSVADMKWAERGLPVSCGGFKHGKPFNTHEQHVFSHLVSWRKGSKKNSYMIYPKRGEIWALFKNWDINWSSKSDALNKSFEYEIVEAVSDFTDVAGIRVIRLAKIKEFTAIFVRALNAEKLEISPKDVLKFSHMVPACRIFGKEKDGVPEGAFELDCASLPNNFEAYFPSISLKNFKTTALNANVSDVGINSVINDDKTLQPTMDNWSELNEKTTPFESVHINSTGSQDAPIRTDDDKISSRNPDTDNHSTPTSLLAFEYPESEFYDFENDRLMEKFECGQLWAFYCEIDSFPKYYGSIEAVDRESNQVYVRCLQFYSTSDMDGQWAKGKPPVCGSFRAIKETCTMDSGETFSHQVQAKSMTMKDHYHIFPMVGQVWAVFRNYGPNSSASELKNTEFDIVEISACRTAEIETLVLTKVDGYVCVFRRQNVGCNAAKLVPFNACSKFSHQIPAYQLKKEMESDDYWELDPAAVPTVFLTAK